jgi:histidinol-phosphate aminotransferase
MTPFELSPLLRPELAEIKPYLPVAGEFSVRLDANEAPPLLSESAQMRLAQAAAATLWHKYPDPTSRTLREAIASHCRVAPEEILVGVGSDELITLLLTVLCMPRGSARTASILTTTPTFVMYRMSARIRGLQVLEVPLDADWDLNVTGTLRAIELQAPNLVFVASPNNPTGTMPARDKLVRLIEAASSSLVVIDEAYVDYAASDQLDLFRAYPNVAVLRTLSKIGFAALRMGWLIGRAELVSELDKARLPYNLNSLSQTLATTVLTELAPELDQTVSRVRAERERVAAELAGLASIQPTPSQANFIWLRTQAPAEQVFEGLAERSVLVRSFHQRGGRLANQLRVTIGTPAENAVFLRALREVV